MTSVRNDSFGDFFFCIPLVNPELTTGALVALQMGALSSRQVENTRTRVEHPDGRLENVAEHSLMLAKVAPELASLLYPALDVNLVARFGTLHDDIEAYVGDTPTDMLSKLDPKAKEKLEAKGLGQLIKEFAHMPGYMKLMTDYENQSVPEARFIRAVDKLMVLLIHFPNQAAVIKANYTYETFLKCEKDLIERDRHKYGEFDKIVDLRRELGQELADRYLR
jgi:5'-deoxynucleotidase YfbR-like HD superfamily hydrolase